MSIMATSSARTRRSAGTRKGSAGTSRAPQPPAKRTYDSTRRRAAAEERQRQVLDVAARRFAADGWTNTTVAEVAEEAGVSPELIFRKIGGKGGLLVGALQQGSAGPGPDLKTAIRQLGLDKETSAAKRLAALADLSARSTEAQAPLVPALATAADQDAEARATVKEVQQRRRAAARALAAALVGAKRSAPADLADEVYVLTSAETYLQFTREAGWSRKRYAEWLHNALRDALARHGVKA